jgi:two-component system cell cycle response regulator
MTGRILVVDDIATNRLLMSLLLSKAYYEVEEARNGAEALEMARRNPPDLALVDVMMPGIDGYELCRQMKADPKLADVPVVMVTALDAQSDRRAALQAGADDFLTKPVRDVALFARLRSLLRMKAMTDELRLRDETLRDLAIDPCTPTLISPPPGACVLNVTSPETGRVLEGMIEGELDVRMHTVSTAREAFAFLGESAPEAIMVDALGFRGFSSDFCTALRQRPEGRTAALLTLLDSGDVVTAAASLDAGANDYVMWPLDPFELTARLRTQLRYKAYADYLRASVKDGLRMAVTDGLTGLHNRRYLDAHLERMITRALAEREPLSVLAFDLDRFKIVNDRYGHAAGDAILREFAQRLLDNTRGVDLVTRTGGEEFIVAMPDAALEDAKIAAERVRAAVEAPSFATGREAIQMTVSVGVAQIHARGDDSASLLARADAALYAAKTSGRNRVELAAA